jgi:hypothetical protein
MGREKRNPSIAVCEDDGFREGLSPSDALLRPTRFPIFYGPWLKTAISF